MQKKLSTTKLVLILLGLIFLLLIGIPLVSIFWPAPAIVVSKETTYVTGPLDDEGRVDYLAAIEQKYFADLPPEENAARHYVQALPDDGQLKGAIRSTVFKRLDLASEHVQPPFLQHYMEFAEAHPELVEQTRQAQGLKFAERVEDDFQIHSLPPDATELSGHWHVLAILAPWTEDDFPLLAEWLNGQQQPLSHIRAGAKLDRCYFPMVGEHPDEPMLYFSMYHSDLRDGTPALAASAMRNLGEGNKQQAWDDAVTMLVIARHMSQQPFLIGDVFGIAMEEIGLFTVIDTVHHGDYTPEELARMAEQFDQLVPLGSVAEEFRGGERLWLLEVLQAQATGRVLDDDYMGELRSLPGVDWNIVMRMANKHYDHMEQAADLPPGDERDRLIKEFDTQIEQAAIEAKNPKQWAASVFSRKSRSNLIGNMQMATLLPAVHAAIQADDRARVRQQLARVAIRLAQYRAAHGEYPENLAQLVPEFAEQPPQDLFTGQPLKYLRTKQGYKLYSVGPNRQDDGGKDATQDETDTLDYHLHDDWGLTIPRPLPVPSWEEREELEKFEEAE